VRSRRNKVDAMPGGDRIGLNCKRHGRPGREACQRRLLDPISCLDRRCSDPIVREGYASGSTVEVVRFSTDIMDSIQDSLNENRLGGIKQGV
jgi:hypothetical protein